MSFIRGTVFIAVLVSVGLVSFFYFQTHKELPQDTKSTQPPASLKSSPEPQASSQPQNSTIALETAWETRTIYPLSIKLDIPSNWSLSEGKDEKNCISYFATSNDDNAVLVFSPCEVSENKSSNWPKDTVVIKNLKGGQYLIRFFDESKDTFIYSYGTKDFLGKSQNGVFKLSSNDSIKITVQLNINPEVSEKDKYLQTADKIISSIGKI